MHIFNFQNFVDMPKTNSNEAFLFATPPISRCFNFLLHERLTIRPKSSIFDSFQRIIIFGAPWRKAFPYLVITLKSTRARKKLSSRPPAAKIKTLLIVYCQLRTHKSKPLKIQPSSLENFETSEIWKPSRKVSTFLIFGISFLFGYKIYYPKTIGKPLLLQRVVGKN